MGFSQICTTAHRFGFNGKEIDSEVAGNGNSYDYGFRIYNPRIGRFLSVDPLTKTFPMLTPYQFASNTPIMAIDLDGLEAKIVIRSQANSYREPIVLSRTDFSMTAWQAIQNAYMAISQDATWAQSKTRDSYLSNPVFKKNDGSYSPPVNGVLNLNFQNDGSVSASYSDRGEKVGGYKQALTQGQAANLIGTAIQEDIAPQIRDGARSISDAATVFEGAMITSTVASGGASGEVTLPLAAGASGVAFAADVTSALMSAIMGDQEGMYRDAATVMWNMATIGGTSKLVDQVTDGMSGPMKHAAEGAVNGGAMVPAEVIDRGVIQQEGQKKQ